MAYHVPDGLNSVFVETERTNTGNTTHLVEHRCDGGGSHHVISFHEVIDQYAASRDAYTRPVCPVCTLQTRVDALEQVCAVFEELLSDDIATTLPALREHRRKAAEAQEMLTRAEEKG